MAGFLVGFYDCVSLLADMRGNRRLAVAAELLSRAVELLDDDGDEGEDDEVPICAPCARATDPGTYADLFTQDTAGRWVAIVAALDAVATAGQRAGVALRATRHGADVVSLSLGNLALLVQRSGDGQIRAGGEVLPARLSVEQVARLCVRVVTERQNEPPPAAAAMN